MMKKRQSPVVPKKTKEAKSSGLLSLLWLILGAIIAAAVAALIYYSPLFDGFRGSEIEIKPEAPVAPITQTVPAPDYEFYEALPKQDFRSVPEGVSVQDSMDGSAKTVGADTVVKAKSNQQAPEEAMIEVIEEDATYDGADEAAEDKPAITYILQIKSYTQAQDADERRAQVMLAGVDALVVRRTDKATGEDFYQVVSAPMASRQEASDALLRLRNNGIDALLVEQRR